MVEIPHSLLDFADALRLLAESQSDVAELVTKWDELCDTTNPKSIKITVGGVEHEIDNLAKIRQDLIKGLSLENPEVTTLKFHSYRARALYESTRRFLQTFNETDENNYGVVTPGSGEVETMNNVLRTVVCPAKARMDLNLLEMPDTMFLGVPKTAGEAPIDTYDIYVKAPLALNVEQDKMRPYHYYTYTKFVNRNFGTGNPIVYNDVTINLHDETGRVTVTKVIPPGRYAEFVFFATPGQDTMNIQEMVPDIPTA